MSLLDDITARLTAMPDEARQQVINDAMLATRDMKFVPNPGAQTDAWFSPAQLLLYGGAAGSGKSGLLLGLALSRHKRSLIMRRQYTDLKALTEEAIKFNGSRAGFNGSPPPSLRTTDGRLIEFGAAAHPGSEQNWKGQPHDFLGFDEAVDFLEAQIRFLMTWNRSTDIDQRCRTVLATNPPVTSSGQWIIGMFRPWLDVTYSNPAKHGELRWYFTAPDGKEVEVDGPAPVQRDGHEFIPESRTFIPGTMDGNPFLAKTNYQSKLDSLPEPYRSAMRDGNFMLAREDDAMQVIPTFWVQEAMARWTPQPPANIPMCAIGVDVAQGGKDDNILSIRHDGWFAPLITVAGAQTPLGTDVSGVVVANRRDHAIVIVDCGGGYGGTVYKHLKDNGIEVVAYKGSETAVARTADRQLRFVNKRSEIIWRMREALDPAQPGGSPIMLPNDPMLIADLTAPTFEIGSRGLAVETKEDVCEKLGRSPDRGDAVCMAWSGGAKAITDALLWREKSTGGRNGKTPTVLMGTRGHRR